MTRTLENWPDCPIDGCRAKTCLALNSNYCFPHTTDILTWRTGLSRERTRLLLDALITVNHEAVVVRRLD